MAHGASASAVRDFRDHSDWSGFNSAVSLHSHTHYSREIMADLPSYIARIPFLAVRFEREVSGYVKREGRAIDFSKGCWHPPVSPRGVFESEAAQIESRFNLAPLVSVTDHDDITAGLELQTLYANRRTPVSFEWTVPYGAGFFHLGVHNLPPDTAGEWYERLKSFTVGRVRETLTELLADLNAAPDLLIVFCHPLWDLAGVGEDEHRRQVRRFLANHCSHVHAIELNGYRSHEENDAAEALAASKGLSLVSGGDRHGRAPNALVNVTRARSFAEFAGEVRDGLSDAVAMPEYQQNLLARKLAAASDVLRNEPGHPGGRVHWTDRVSWERDGSVRPLSFHWPGGGPFWVRSSVAAFQLLANPVVLPVLGAALDTVDGVRHP
jgi:hypothetical protein